MSARDFRPTLGGPLLDALATGGAAKESQLRSIGSGAGDAYATEAWLDQLASDMAADAAAAQAADMVDSFAADQPAEEPCMACAPNAAGQAPKFVFRGDERPPEVIFKEGFQPRGTDTDLHVFTATNSPSAFVSTSKNPNVARDFAEQQGDGYVYTALNQPGARDVNAELGSRSPFPHEEEIAVEGGVPASAILGARRVGPDGKFVGPFIPNPGHVKGKGTS